MHVYYWRGWGSFAYTMSVWTATYTVDSHIEFGFLFFSSHHFHHLVSHTHCLSVTQSQSGRFMRCKWFEVVYIILAKTRDLSVWQWELAYWMYVYTWHCVWIPFSTSFFTMADLSLFSCVCVCVCVCVCISVYVCVVEFALSSVHVAWKKRKNHGIETCFLQSIYYKKSLHNYM